MRRLLWSLVLGGALLAGLAFPAGAAEDERVTVMARNLYLGADVGVALDLLPDLPAAAQFMWEQVAATDFDARVSQLAAEAARYGPDVIALQEATVWACRPSPVSAPRPVFDFTEQFLEATAAAGVEYVVAESDGERAYNPGYEIPAIPFLTEVRDPQTFQPLFGSDTADCGFTIADALLVRADLAPTVQAAGTSELTDRYAVVPVVFTIDRGYAWADLALAGTTVRVVTAHLESLWSEGDPVPGALQAQQLVEDLASTTAPLIVLGDFNADPRDPRPPADPNPAEQPTASQACPAQPPQATAETADPDCNAYWTMITNGYASAGPDENDSANYTWGSAADLAGPDPERLSAALELGNEAGFTERLDHVFLTNGAEPVQARIIGNEWPNGDDLWACKDPAQVATTEESSQILAEAGVAEAITGEGVCLPTDHAGIVAVVDVTAGPAGVVAQPAPDTHESFRIGLLGWLGIILGVVVLVVVLLVWLVLRLVRRRGRRRRARQTEADAGVSGQGAASSSS